MDKDKFESLRNQIYESLSESFGKTLGEPLTPGELHNVETLCKDALDSYLKTLGYDELKLSSYKVICDESNNSPEDIKSNAVNVTIVPTVEHITVEFVLNEIQEIL